MNAPLRALLAASLLASGCYTSHSTEDAPRRPPPPIPDGGRVDAPTMPFGELRDAQVSFVESPAGLERGQIAGAILVEDGVEAAARLMPGIEDTVRSVLESVADIRPSPSDPAICERLSIGMTFEAVPAELVEP